MSGRMYQLLVITGALAMSLHTQDVKAQFYNQNYGYNYGAGDVCNPCAQQAAMIPVQQVCYQRVPVTTYVQEKRTVQVPEVKTAWVDETYTAYRPQTEQRTAEVPYVTYQNVTECRQVCQDKSYWRSRVEPVCKVSPCQYDPRPNFMGWMNRTAYSLRSAMTPNQRIRREYVPNKVVQNVPYTRQVAVRSTRQVTYNVTTMVPYQATRKVAKHTTQMVDREITVSTPRTVYQTIPSGTTTAWVPNYGGATATAFGAAPTRAADAGSPTRSAQNPEKIKSRSEKDPFGSNKINQNYNPAPGNNNGFDPVKKRTKSGSSDGLASAGKFNSKPGVAKRRAPSITRVGRWVPRRAARPNTSELKIPTLEPKLAVNGK